MSLSSFNDADRGLPFIESLITNVLVSSDFDAAPEQRRDKWRGKVKHKFQIKFEHNTKSEIEAIRDFFVDKNGPHESFTFTNPNDSIDYTVRFDGDSFKIERRGYDDYNAEVTLIECF